MLTMDEYKVVDQITTELLRRRRSNKS